MNPGTARIKAVDPNLRVVSGGSRRHRKPPVDHDGMPTGEICPLCGEEAMRFVNGVCPTCAKEGRTKTMTDEEIEDKAERSYVKKEFWSGRLSLEDMKAGYY